MITKKFCPKCGSEEIMMAGGGIMGIWVCKNCGFSGSIFPEKPILGAEQKNLKKTKKLKNKRTV